jgi:hypothetical protein
MGVWHLSDEKSGNWVVFLLIFCSIRMVLAQDFGLWKKSRRWMFIGSDLP